MIRYLGKSADHHFFDIPHHDFNTVFNWVIYVASNFHAGPITAGDHPDLNLTAPAFGISLPLLSDVIRFEQHFPVDGLSVEDLLS